MVIKFKQSLPPKEQVPEQAHLVTGTVLGEGVTLSQLAKAFPGVLGALSPTPGQVLEAKNFLDKVGEAPKVESTPTPKKVGKFLASKLAENALVMPATKQAKLAGPEVTITSVTTAMVIELVDLDGRMKDAGAYEMVKRIDELKKTLQSIAKDADPVQPVTFTCPSGVVVFGECRHETKISDKPMLIKLMGTAEYIEASSITLGDAKKYLSENELAKVVTVGYGSRTLKSITQSPVPG